ncbi:hypothetical protein F5B22DRAFT_507941 [Xylaria bambusicola]|uniref:uncharacterized protein n=1 Tax=Xylaria bambusicola TaxID=326684 RepID=UPI0020072A6C|nr:uncharacterized protein F5B22DRAFT_507941 [Xylaria bambusicola]KAI0521875.1 hypothetical protein F5B22DRAFT_507941 [Xylaria bambusicola]
MDPHQLQKCKWTGGCPNNTIIGGPYCHDHRRQYYEIRHPQPDKNDNFCSSSSIPSIPKDSAATRLGNRSTENGSLNSPYASRVPPPKLDKKQFQDIKHVARKSVKSSLSSGQPQASPVAAVQMLPSDLPSANPRPLKRQRVSGVPNLSEPRPKSNSSFSENGIPPLSKRGMLRQSEERTYKLSAIDDFALRPKKKDAVIEPARSNTYNDQRQSSRGDTRPSSSGRQPAPVSNQQPQSNGLNGLAHPGSPVIIADDSGSTLPRPKPQPQPQPPPKNFIPNGTPEVGRPIPKPLLDGKTELFREKVNVVTPSNKQGREGPIQPGGVAQVKHGPSASVEQTSKKIYAQKAPQSTIPSPSTVQDTSRPRQPNGLSPKSSGDKQRVTAPTQNNGLGPVSVNSSNTSIHPQLPPTKQHQPVNGVRQASVEEGNSIPIKGWTPINLVRKDSKPEQSPITKATKTKQITPVPEVISPVPQETRLVSPDQNHNMQSPVPLVPPVQIMQSTPATTPVTVTETSEPPSSRGQGPLSALLGDREWKKMSPEERRLFWVSQHDADAFDAQIYSENNRPFRPGDKLFGLPEDELPPRPKRAATHFDYIDPRPSVPVYRFEEWYEKKQDEIKSRGGRKANFGKAVKRLAQQKSEASNLSQKTQAAVPQRVQDNPKWLAALDILKQIEAQNRAKKRRARLAKQKETPASANDSFFACRHGIKQLSISD